MQTQAQDRRQKVDGFPYWARRNYIFVADFGQPDRSEGGIHLGDFNYGVYRFDLWRYGEVISTGPGLLREGGVREPMPNVKLGDIVLFSRKHGTRLPGSVRFDHPKYPDAKDGLLVRVLDPDKVVAVVDGFDPWWNVAQRQRVDPGVDFSG